MLFVFRTAIACHGFSKITVSPSGIVSKKAARLSPKNCTVMCSFLAIYGYNSSNPCFSAGEISSLPFHTQTSFKNALQASMFLFLKKYVRGPQRPFWILEIRWVCWFVIVKYCDSFSPIILSSFSLWVPVNSNGLSSGAGLSFFISWGLCLWSSGVFLLESGWLGCPDPFNLDFSSCLSSCCL